MHFCTPAEHLLDLLLSDHSFICTRETGQIFLYLILEDFAKKSWSPFNFYLDWII
jgi:hypothetical protein